MSSMFSGFGDWLRGSPGGAAPGGGAPMGGGMGGGGMGGGSRGGMISQTIQGMANPTNNLVQGQQGQQPGGNQEEALWAMLQKLVAQRGLPGQGGPGGGAMGARISGPPGQAPGGVPPMGGLY